MNNSEYTHSKSGRLQFNDPGVNIVASTFFHCMAVFPIACEAYIGEFSCQLSRFMPYNWHIRLVPVHMKIYEKVTELSPRFVAGRQLVKDSECTESWTRLLWPRNFG